MKWNELSEYRISAKTVNSFKARIDKEMFGIDRSNNYNGSAIGYALNALLPQLI